MGKLILCRGLYATIPYKMKTTNTKIYSIEEMCYYIYHNLEFVMEEKFSTPFTEWLKNELNLMELAHELEGIEDSKKTLFKIAHSSNYFSDSEIREIKDMIIEFEDLPPTKRKIKKANNYLNINRYKEADAIYERILSGEELGELTREEYASILYNQAIAKIHILGLQEAAPLLKEVYERTNAEEHLKQYLFALKLSSQEELLIKEISYYELQQDWVNNILKELKELLKEAEIYSETQLMQKLEMDRMSNNRHFYETSNEITKDLEKQYRRVSGWEY